MGNKTIVFIEARDRASVLVNTYPTQFREKKTNMFLNSRVCQLSIFINTLQSAEIPRVRGMTSQNK